MTQPAYAPGVSFGPKVDPGTRRSAVKPPEPQTEVAYSPIEYLPNVTMRYVIVYNACNGPCLQELVLAEDAADLREMGVWTHFLLLPKRPEPSEAARPQPSRTFRSP